MVGNVVKPDFHHKPLQQNVTTLALLNKWFIIILDSERKKNWVPGGFHVAKPMWYPNAASGPSKSVLDGPDQNPLYPPLSPLSLSCFSLQIRTRGYHVVPALALQTRSQSTKTSLTLTNNISL